MSVSGNEGAILPLAQVVLGTSDTVIYTGLSGSTAPIVTYVNILWIANTDSNDRTFTLHYWLTGALTVSNSLTEAQSIKANTSFYYNFHNPGLPIPTGYTLYGKADSAAKITATIFGSVKI